MKTDPIKKITNAIIRHPQNKEMKQKGYIPIFTASTSAKIVLIGQAPGIKAQESKVPWNDKSGEQLKKWLSISEKDFYDASKVALIPMDFYFPGKGETGDLPPRPGFAELWHPQLFEVMPKSHITILIGQYAQGYYLEDKEPTLTETVRQYKKYLKQGFLPIPHPSPRNNIWKAKNPWFEIEVVPVLQKEIKKALR